MSDLPSFAFEPGQKVQCKTRFDDVLKGEVVAFDLNSKILILKTPTLSGTSTNHDLHFLVLDSVADVEVLEDAHGECANELPSIDMKYIQLKQQAALSERLRLVEAVGNGVSRDGISLYTSISKIFDRPNVSWKDKVKIVVMNNVVISPPYKESNCELISSSTEKDALAYVKSNVRKFWEDSSKQKSVG